MISEKYKLSQAQVLKYEDDFKKWAEQKEKNKAEIA
jgi:hypothetical protein